MSDPHLDLGTKWSAVLLLAVLSGCASRTEHWYLSETPHTPPAAWSYSGATGPEHWGDLDPSYAAAKDGHEQSPIDIQSEAVQASDAPPLEFHYRTEIATALNNGHTIEHKAEDGSYVEFDGTRYTLEQFHLHTPSEHTVDGVQSPMEIHLVHQDAAGHVLVVSVLVAEGVGEHPVQALPRAAGDVTTGTSLAMESLLPDERSYYHYEGSFTTPPCTEGVKWFVLRTQKRLPADFIAAVAATEGSNHRPVQPLDGRVVSSGGSSPPR